MSIFGKIGERTRNFVDNAAGFFTNKVDEFELKNEISSNKQYLEGLYAELGRLAYHGNNVMAPTRTKDVIVSEIDTVTAGIKSLEEELTAMLAKTETIKVESKATTFCYCHKCGEPQSKGSTFCNKCGTKLIK